MTKKPQETERTISEQDLSHHIGYSLMHGIRAGIDIQEIHKKTRYLQSEIQLNPFNPFALEHAEGEVHRTHLEVAGLCKKIDSQIDNCLTRASPEWQKEITSLPLGYYEAVKEFNEAYQKIDKRLKEWGGKK